MRIPAFILILISLFLPAQAGGISSEYTRLDIDKNCVFEKQVESDGQGGSATCTGFRGYEVHFSEGDLRQMVEFGFIGSGKREWSSFGEWNSVGKTIEWRLNEERPVATILRWYIENIDSATGSSNPKLRGQVLVISKVGQPSVFDACIVGYVDARANRDANIIARNVADDIAPYFQCGREHPKYYGRRGPGSGSPGDVSN